MDALSSLLEVAELEAALFSRARLSAPWGVRTRGTPTAIFHVILQGEGWLIPDDDGEPTAFRAGDILLLPHGQGHVLADRPERNATSITALPTIPSDDGLRCVVSDGGGTRTELVCGTLSFGDAGQRFVAPHLPGLLHVSGGPVSWLDATVRLLAEELAADRPGSDLLARRLTEMLVVQALRVWIQDERPPRGWPAALADEQLARALTAIHDRPERPWSASELAREAGMSRSAFYARFGEVLGEAPSAYLLRWRMVLARTALRKDARVAEVANLCGYGSEAAFSRAFKRHVGLSPTAWRRRAS